MDEEMLLNKGEKKPCKLSENVVALLHIIPWADCLALYDLGLWIITCRPYPGYHGQDKRQITLIPYLITEYQDNHVTSHPCAYTIISSHFCGAQWWASTNENWMMSTEWLLNSLFSKLFEKLLISKWSNLCSYFGDVLLCITFLGDGRYCVWHV